MSAYGLAMCRTTHLQSAALARVCRLVVEAEEQGHATVPAAELRRSLSDVAVEQLARPIPAPAVSLRPGPRVVWHRTQRSTDA